MTDEERRAHQQQHEEAQYIGSQLRCLTAAVGKLADKVQMLAEVISAQTVRQAAQAADKHHPE